MRPDVEQPTSTSSRSKNGRRIAADCDVLVVDDDDDCRDVLCFLLSSEGYRVQAAASGAAALDELAKMVEPPRLVLLDLVMPGMSGFELLGEMRRAPALAAIPVVVHSGLGEQPYRGTPPGVAAWLQKPVRLDQLLDITRQLTR